MLGVKVFGYLQVRASGFFFVLGRPTFLWGWQSDGADYILLWIFFLSCFHLGVSARDSGGLNL
jgi:hypothetical protein